MSGGRSSGMRAVAAHTRRPRPRGTFHHTLRPSCAHPGVQLHIYAEPAAVRISAAPPVEAVYACAHLRKKWAARYRALDLILDARAAEA